MGASMYGKGGSMYGAGMMGSPYYGGGTMGPMSSLNQFLFSVQNVIFSLGQAVQVRQSGVFGFAHKVGLISCFHVHYFLWIDCGNEYASVASAVGYCDNHV